MSAMPVGVWLCFGRVIVHNARREFYTKPSLAKRLKSAQAAKVRKKEARRDRERTGFDL